MCVCMCIRGRPLLASLMHWDCPVELPSTNAPYQGKVEGGRAKQRTSGRTAIIRTQQHQVQAKQGHFHRRGSRTHPLNK